MKRILKSAVGVWLAIGSAALLCAQAPVSAPPANGEFSDGGPAVANLEAANLGYEAVGPGDLVALNVTGSSEFSRSLRVSEDGKLTLPLLKSGVPVAGLTPAGIAQAVRAALVREKILVDPIVSVGVLEYRSRRVSVVGAVKTPGSFQAIGEMRLLDAIARAQGTSPEAGPEIIVTFPNSKTAAREPLHVQIKALMAAKDPAMNIVLHGGEEIRVPEAPRLFVVGNIKMPGSYPMTDPEGSSVLKALAISQGVLPFAGKRAYIYRVAQSGAPRQEIEIELKQILHRKSPDVPLLANDILYIPDNAGMRLSATALDRIAGFGSSLGSGMLILH